MNKNFNNEIINAYLLGNLPEAEAENFDELSFTDDDFAVELNSAENDLVDAYVRGELSGTTLERFKSYYLASPARREKVNFARVFQDFGEEKIKKNPIPDGVKENKQNLSGLLSGFFTFQYPLLQWSLAVAALVVMIFGGYLYYDNSRLRSEISKTQDERNERIKSESELLQSENKLQNEITTKTPQNFDNESEPANIRLGRKQLQKDLNKPQQQTPQIAEQKRTDEKTPGLKKQPTAVPNRQPITATFLLLPSLRGNNSLQSISIPPKTDKANMRLEFESGDYSAYRVALKDLSNGQTLWQSGKIKAKVRKSAKFLNVIFPAKLLKTSIYTLEVSGITVDGTTENLSNYSFRVEQ